MPRNFVEGSDDFFLNDDRNAYHDYVANQIRAGRRPVPFPQFIGGAQPRPSTPSPSLGGGASSLNLGALLGIEGDAESEKLGPLFQALLALQRGGQQEGLFSLFSGIQL